MIERRGARPPVTYTTFQARDLGGDTANLFRRACEDAVERFQPGALLVGASCTAELIQDDPGGLARSLNLPIPLVPLELPSYQKKENWGASETLYQLVRTICHGVAVPQRAPIAGRRPRANLLGATALGFRHRDDVTELTRLLDLLGVDVHVVAPLNASVADLRRLPEADFNVVMYPELGLSTASWLQRTFHQPHTTIVPIGVGATRDFAAQVAGLAGSDPVAAVATIASRLPWYSRSVDSTYLTGKRVFIFGDGTHALAAARIAREELGFEVVGLGTYSREMARDVRPAAEALGLTALISDDYLAVEQAIIDASPELVLGTQMERHVAKRLGIPCAVISAPVHVQDFPARYSPQMGAEGANVIFDSWVHPLMMGLEEHLLGMFREDFEFADGASPSHLGHGSARATASAPRVDAATVANDDASSFAATATANATLVAETEAGATGPTQWSSAAEAELKKIPFFVRGKARRNTERYATAQGIALIDVDTLYEAKAHYGR
jgi:light-independent protochlorophyllide reductase subunit B